jgi:23S rRNA pseudouridine1911/1915/1917 synthase
VKDDPPNLRPLAKWVRHGAIRIQDPEVRSRLDRYLAGRFPYRSRTQWARVIDGGRILVNGRACRPSRVIQFGDRVDYRPPPRIEPDVDVEVRILHEDDALLAVDKPPDLPVHPSGRYFRNTLLCVLLRERGETLDRPGIRIVHRLDRETSGVVLFGKSRESAAALARQFEEHSVRKEYLALVHGCPQEERFRVEASLGRNQGSKVRKAVGVVADGEGRTAVTDFEVAARGPQHSLLIARPVTGRLHQIRVHSRHAGYPIVGDKLYGLDESYFLKLAAGGEYTEEEWAKLLISRQGLHAWRVSFRHPRTGEPATITAPIPDDLRALCARLGLGGLAAG